MKAAMIQNGIQKPHKNILMTACARWFTPFFAKSRTQPQRWHQQVDWIKAILEALSKQE
jgi:hypothetical protein